MGVKGCVERRRRLGEPGGRTKKGTETMAEESL